MPEEQAREFEPVRKYEPVDRGTVEMLGRNLGLAAMVVELGKVDLDKGAGVISDKSKCLWTTDGKRITFSLVTGGGFIATQSKEPDPLYEVEHPMDPAAPKEPSLPVDEPDKMYRYEETTYSRGVNEVDDPLPGYHLVVRCREYTIVRRTPKGAWIVEGSPHDQIHGFEKFVLLTARKKFACETRADALESFRARKRRQLGILEARANKVKLALEMADRIEKGEPNPREYVR
jgi:hypothetical protein